MSCYYVLNTKKLIITSKSFIRCESLKEARKLSREMGGIILKGMG